MFFKDKKSKKEKKENTENALNTESASEDVKKGKWYARKKKKQPAKKKTKKPTSLKNDIAFLLMKLGILVLLAVVMFVWVFGLMRAPDDTMSPAFKNGDLILYYRMQQEYAANDVVVIQRENESMQVRRIIAVPDDKVDITPEGLEINGYVQDETSIYNETLPYAEGVEFPITLGAGEYFVLGDYRTNVADSRYYGPVTKDDIKGGVMSVLRRRNF